MLVKEIFLGFIGLTAGFAVSAGTFAFMIVLGVLPRMIGKCNRAAETLHFENMIMLGGIFGNIISVFLNLKLPFGTWFLYLYGFTAGMFVGCLAVALAEILNTFPITFRRFHIKQGLAWMLFFYGDWKNERLAVLFFKFDASCNGKLTRKAHRR